MRGPAIPEWFAECGNSSVCGLLGPSVSALLLRRRVVGLSGCLGLPSLLKRCDSLQGENWRFILHSYQPVHKPHPTQNTACCQAPTWAGARDKNLPLNMEKGGPLNTGRGRWCCRCRPAASRGRGAPCTSPWATGGRGTTPRPSRTPRGHPSSSRGGARGR